MIGAWMQNSSTYKGPIPLLIFSYSLRRFLTFTLVVLMLFILAFLMKYVCLELTSSREVSCSRHAESNITKLLTKSKTIKVVDVQSACENIKNVVLNIKIKADEINSQPLVGHMKCPYKPDSFLAKK
jgi:hypothetical protein